MNKAKNVRVSKGLKSCPFCGSKNVGITYDEFGIEANAEYIVECKECGCSLWGSPSTQVAIEKWNRRASK